MKNYFILLILFNISFIQAQTWDQIGIDIEGVEENDDFGVAVSFSSDANTLAVGASGFYNSLSPGYSKIYDWNGTDWIQKGGDIIGDSIGENFGQDINLSGDGSTVVISGPTNNFNGENAGIIKIFKWNGSSWIQKGTNLYGEAAWDFFGSSVSLNNDGNILACGASNNTNSNGMIKFFQWNGTDWIQMGNNILGSNNDRLGISCELNEAGNIAIVGAQQFHYNGTAPSYGYAEVYEWNGIDWIQKGLSIIGDSIGDQMGKDTEINADGNTIAVRAGYNDINGINSGQTKVFEWNGSNWIQKGNDILGEAAGDGVGGSSISLSSDGNIIAIGAGGNDDNGPGFSAGHTRVYSWNGSNWHQKGIDIDGEAPGDVSGLRIALSYDGTRLAIGAGKNDGANLNAGHVRVFDFCEFLERTDSIVSCEPFTWIDGNTYTETTSTNYSISNANSCDSLINLKLTVNDINTNLIQDGTELAAQQNSLQYQWINCDDNNSYLLAETNQNYIATENGNYALEINNNNCIDTSNCYTINNVVIIDQEFNNIIAYPNPTSGTINIEINNNYNEISIDIYDITGKLTQTQIFKNNKTILIDINEFESGFYFVIITSQGKSIGKLKVLKE